MVLGAIQTEPRPWAPWICPTSVVSYSKSADGG